MVPDLMPAAVYVGDGRLEVQQLAVPTPGPDQVLVEVAQCGICGTDLHLVHERYARPGTVLGHEWAGTIVAVGHDVTGWSIGEAVVSDPTPGCGRCRACRRGRPSVCRQREATDYLDFRGAFCRFVTVAAARLLRLPPGLSTRTAALTEPTAIALHAVALADVEPADRVLITGGGAVGLLILAVLRARGIDHVTVSEPASARQERARALGATRVVDPAELPAAAMGLLVEDPFDVAFECSGHARAAESALDQLDFAGTLVLVGTGGEPPRVNHNRMIILELSAIGTYNYDAAGFAPALDLLASGGLPVDLLIAPDDVLLDGLADTIDQLVLGQIPGKVLVRPEVSTS
jgi:(R,R)-butanediol dehydrogenase / meso-butanediol dehydrogenase / diacetyl reductase